MKDRAVRVAAHLRQTIEAAEASLAAGDVQAATEALVRHHRLLNLAASMTAELFNEPAEMFSGGGSKEEEKPPIEGLMADDLSNAA